MCNYCLLQATTEEELMGNRWIQLSRSHVDDGDNVWMCVWKYFELIFLCV